MDLSLFIRDVPDFPQAGIMFKDITPLLQNSEALAEAVEVMAAPWEDEDIDIVVAVEARGYILGAPVGLWLGAGFVPARKPGKLPYRTIRVEYALEYGTDALEMHHDGLAAGQRVLIVDDILATGGTMAAAVRLVEDAGAEVVGLSVLGELVELGGRQRLEGYRLESALSL